MNRVGPYCAAWDRVSGTCAIQRADVAGRHPGGESQAMRFPRRAAVPAVSLVVLVACGAPTAVHASASGGTRVPPAVSIGGGQAPPVALTGGSTYNDSASLPAGSRPVVAELSVPSTARAGRPPRVEFQIGEPGVGTVQARVTVTELATGTVVIAVDMGWVRVGRAQRVIWPRRTTLNPGTYMVSLSAHDHHGRTLLRRADGSGQVRLTIAAQAKTPSKGSTSWPLPSALALPAGVPTPAETAAAGAVFPLAGAHSFGGPGNRFGAPRSGYTHQGQDVLTAEGTAVVVPMAGTIVTTGYQAGGAGYYAVEHTSMGFDFMLAHCQSQSLLLSAGEAVSAGQALCAAGQTGDATTPHLYFEIWVGGWQASGGHTIDPLPYLQAWERGGAVA